MVQIETKKLNIDNKFKKKLSSMFAHKSNNQTPVSLGTSTSTPIYQKKNNSKFKKKIPIKNESNTIKNKYLKTIMKIMRKIMIIISIIQITVLKILLVLISKILEN